MEIYNSEEEQLEAIQKWWQQNRWSVITGIIVGIAVIVGWNVWQNYTRQQTLEASTLYQQLLQAVNAKQPESASKLSERLIENYGSSPYAPYAGLFQAKLQAEAGDLAAAKATLETAIASAADQPLEHIARLRLLQVMLALSEQEAALKLIAATDIHQAGSFEGHYEELKGDILASLNRISEARNAYKQALALGQNSRFLQMKLDDIAPPPIQESAE